MTLILYFIGSPTVLTQLQSSSSWGAPVDTTCKPILDPATNQTVSDPFCRSTQNSNNNSVLGLMLLIIGAAGILAGLLLGFSAIYVMAIVILIGIMNFFVFPYGIFINTAILPPELGLPLLFFFNVLTVLGISDFVRGGA
jgi:membrane-bound ClpP family serine protease